MTAVCKLHHFTSVCAITEAISPLKEALNIPYNGVTSRVELVRSARAFTHKGY